MQAVDGGVFRGWTGLARAGTLAVAAALALGAAPAGAAVLSSLQGLGNGQYEATLRDTDLVNFEAADLEISYAASLTFVSGDVGGLDPANFMVSFGAPVLTGGGHSLLASISHGLAATASGDAVILRLLFETSALKPLPLNDGVSFATADASLYDFTPTSATAGGTPPPSVPEGSSAALAAIALLALRASRRNVSRNVSRNVGRNVG